MNINRDYIVKLFLAKSGASRGKIEANNIVFFTSDRYTQNIFLVADVDITDLDRIDLMFGINDRYYSVIGTVLDDKTVLFDLDYDDLEMVGTYKAVVCLTEGENILTSDPFTFIVKANLLREGDNNES